MQSNLFAQTVFWSEDFNNGCTSGCEAVNYSGTNGNWTQTILGVEGADFNIWYISCAANGHTNNICGSGCQPVTATATGASLHVGSHPNSLGDIGAAYDAGGLCGLLTCPQTNRRIESPSINCSGYSNITCAFDYIELGAPPVDDAIFWYYDGSTWAVLINTPSTNNSGCGSAGRWTNYTIALPASANNNPAIKLGIQWINNDDGIGTDPSFAIDNLQLYITQAPLPLASFAASNVSFCDSVCISFADSSINSPTSWQWVFTGANPATATVQSPTNICYNVPGTYDVTLICSNAAGADTLTLTNYITVNPCHMPVVQFYASDTLLCEESCISFFDLSTNNPTQWFWTFNGAMQPDTSSLQNPTLICYNTVGTYTVTLTATNAQGSTTATYTSYITVNPNPPTPIISLNGQVLVSTPAYSYQWYLGALPLIGETNQVLFAPTPGDYYVIVTDSNGCFSISNTISITTGITDLTSNILMISPNPASNAFSIVVHAVVGSTDKFIVINNLGQVVLEQALLEKNVINSANWPSGIYAVRCFIGDKTIVKSIIIR
ncbi:MAG: PKD domain-containing protein [Bacteroidia bacterium]|nr:PKD domain-containing protein [Bacteroidia bacterium]